MHLQKGFISPETTKGKTFHLLPANQAYIYDTQQTKATGSRKRNTWATQARRNEKEKANPITQRLAPSFTLAPTFSWANSSDLSRKKTAVVTAFSVPAQLVRGFALSDLLDKPWSQVSSRLPPATLNPPATQGSAFPLFSLSCSSIRRGYATQYWRRERKDPVAISPQTHRSAFALSPLSNESASSNRLRGCVCSCVAYGEMIERLADCRHLHAGTVPQGSTARDKISTLIQYYRTSLHNSALQDDWHKIQITIGIKYK